MTDVVGRAGFRGFLLRSREHGDVLGASSFHEALVFGLGKLAVFAGHEAPGFPRFVVIDQLVVCKFEAK